MVFPATQTRGRFEIGRVFDTARGMLTANFWQLFLILVGVSLLISALTTGLRLALTGQLNGVEIGAVATLLVVITIPLAVFQNVFNVTVPIYAYLAHARGERPSIRRCLSESLPLLLPATGLGLLMVLGLFVAYVLFVIPAVILSLIWAVAFPVLIAERKGVMHAFNRSADLTRDNRVLIFAINLIVGVINLVVFGLVIALFGVLGGGAFLRPGAMTSSTAFLVIFTVGGILLSTAVVLANCAIAPAVYVELTRIRTGGVSVASVFD
jgi:hypothetical protein